MHHNRACIFKLNYIHGLDFFCKTDKQLDKKQDEERKTTRKTTDYFSFL